MGTGSVLAKRCHMPEKFADSTHRLTNVAAQSEKWPLSKLSGHHFYKHLLKPKRLQDGLDS